jgi:hypothetical protein
LQETIGKPPGGASDIKADQTVRVDRAGIQRRRKLLPASTDKTSVSSRDLDNRIFENGLGRFIDHQAVHPDLTRKNHPPRDIATLRQFLLDQEMIKAIFSGTRAGYHGKRNRT